MTLEIEKGLANKILRRESKKIEKITPEIQDFIKKMFQVMEENQGIGFAAPQLGKNWRIFVVAPAALEERSSFRLKSRGKIDSQKGLVFINPEIRSISPATKTYSEGCLSIPGQIYKVRRAKKLTISALDRAGKPFKLWAKGLLAEVIQHEMDHLNGILIYDRSIR